VAQQASLPMGIGGIFSSVTQDNNAWHPSRADIRYAES